MDIKELMQILNFDKSDTECILSTDGKCGDKVREIARDFYDGKIEYKESVEKVGKECLGCAHEYTLHMLYALCCGVSLYEKYAEKNLPYELYVNAMMDLKYKLDECRSVYDICGTMSGKWFGGFFDMTRFAHGRLQYDYKEFEFDDYSAKNLTVKKGDVVLACHIPSSGPLTEESITDSLKKAYEFNKDMDFVKKYGVLPVMCGSWLLYPKYKEVFGENSNTTRFAQMFDIFKVIESESFENGWRVFKSSWAKSPEELDEDTSMQRRFKKWILEGKSHGAAYGMLFFDGEKIVGA